LVGRTRELDDLDKLLRMRSGAIVTLTGTGGVGKTRLAVEAAHQLAPGFADGTAFVGLATVPQAELVPFAIARAFDAATTEQLMAMLATRELLLVLDNLEHVVDAAPFVAQLDAACPNLTILATSRVPLRISNERVVSIQPLSVAESNAPLDEVRSSGAGQLFAERARQIDPQFALSEQNASVVNAICQRLEGIPLAIGLAASRLRVLTVPAMLDRLDRRLPMLTGGAHDLHPRQHSMRQTIAWSYDLLDPAAQRALRWMSVFVGGVSLESVDAVGRALGHDADASLELVTTLLEAGMLYRIGTADDEPRFQLFETIREFGLDRLDVDGELQTARQFYANHFLGLVLHAFKVPYQPVDPVWLGQVESEHHNLVQAFDILNQPETVELAVQFAAPMAWIWRTRGPFSEGQARILRVIGLAPAEPSLAKADMLISATYFIGLMDTPSLSYQIAHSAVEVAEQTGSELYRATARQALAFVEEYNLQFDRARSIYDEILPIWEREENEIMQAICLMLLGGIEYASGNLDRAYANEQRAVELFLRVGDLRNAAVSTWYQGMFAIAQGRMDHAAEMCDRALRMWLEADTERMWFKAFASLADVAAAIGLFESSAHFLGATDQMLRELGAELMPFDKPGYDR
ncbi:MAG: hypothetical protein KC438_14250, partial [Thermomicrobiales bacterium]|nr:hypothetical protein [Thermomicrobiales bacterium]